MTLKTFLLTLTLLLFSTYSFSQAQTYKTVDPLATAETKALYYNLHQLTGKGVMFGHQDDLAYGLTWSDEKGRSDIKDVVGAYPAVYGWDISKIGSRINIDSVVFKKMIRYIKEGYKRGGVITISWHMDNYKTGGDSWDKTPAVADMLPNGSVHSLYKEKLDLFVKFNKKLKVKGVAIPIIFRPFHENSGSWFWWGKDNCTSEDYIALWKFTVNYLRDQKECHNLLYAYATDVFDSEEAYFDRYPGDEYVDILGYDDYHSIKNDLPTFQKRLKLLNKMGKDKGKVTALSETGVNLMNIENWFTKNLLETIKSDPEASRITWVLLWRNGYPGHYFAPYKGHPISEDFKKFKNDEFTIFGDNIPNMYALPE